MANSPHSQAKASERIAALIDDGAVPPEEMMAKIRAFGSSTEPNSPAGPELPTAIADEIASWRRVFGTARRENGRDLLRRAAADLWQALAINKTMYPDNAAPAQQAAVDALHDFAVLMGVGEDDAQLIIVDAKQNGKTGTVQLGRTALGTQDQDADKLAPVLDHETDEARPPAFSDEALALRFAIRYADSIRYIAPWGRWLFCDGRRWRFDETLAVFDLVRRLCRQVAEEAGDKSKVGVAIASAKTVAAVERLARSDRRLAATVEQWDADPWLLNTPAGAVDLRTGIIRPTRAVDYMTKSTGVAPDRSCPITTWLGFLHRVTGGDESLIAFLKRMAGYAISGSTREHALFFVYGTGANGKSTFLGVITACAGDYHRTAAIETFTAAKGDRHPTDVAGLRGARLVTAVETEEGRGWAESKIKSLTGGDKIAARFMRQDFFEFTPTFKLVIAGNHKPGLRSVDEAIRRRFNLVPFTVTIPPEERDKSLPDRLRAEWPGILAWMIDGCLEWQLHGLAAPEAVRVATMDYLEAEDALSAWIEDVAERDPNAWETSSALFKSWRAWADRAGEHVGSQKKLTQRLADRADAIGVRKARDAHGQRGFYGLRLIDAQGQLQP
jgi:putative DNA primase/helicase